MVLLKLVGSGIPKCCAVDVKTVCTMSRAHQAHLKKKFFREKKTKTVPYCAVWRWEQETNKPSSNFTNRKKNVWRILKNSVTIPPLTSWNKRFCCLGRLYFALKKKSLLHDWQFVCLLISTPNGAIRYGFCLLFAKEFCLQVCLMCSRHCTDSFNINNAAFGKSASDKF